MFIGHNWTDYADSFSDFPEDDAIHNFMCWEIVDSDKADNVIEFRCLLQLVSSKTC